MIKTVLSWIAFVATFILMVWMIYKLAIDIIFTHVINTHFEEIMQNKLDNDEDIFYTLNEGYYDLETL